MDYVLVTGSREGQSYENVERVLDLVVKSHTQGEVTLVHGGARGLDIMAGAWARSRGHAVEVHAAKWNTHDPRHETVPCRHNVMERTCKAAGVRRNADMLAAHDYALCIAFPRGEARGTNDMIARMRDAGYSVVTDYGPTANDEHGPYSGVCGG